MPKKLIIHVAYSLHKNYKGILLILIASILTSVGQSFWKLSANENSILLIAVGFICYGFGALILIIAFKFGSLSVVHPFLATGYVFAIFISSYFFHETISVHKIIGIILICSGVILIGVGDE